MCPFSGQFFEIKLFSLRRQSRSPDHKEANSATSDGALTGDAAAGLGDAVDVMRSTRDPFLQKAKRGVAAAKR